MGKDKRVLEISFSEPQHKVITCTSPLLLALAGQRSGKSFSIGVRTALKIIYFPRMVGMIAANTYKQLTQSTMVEVRRVWKKNFGFNEYTKNNPNGDYVINRKPPAHFNVYQEFDSYDGIISFRNGCNVFTASLDNYMVHDGKTMGWAELDETKDTKEQAVKHVILARLSQPGLYYNEFTKQVAYMEEDPGPDTDFIPYNPCVINTSPSEGVVDWLIEMFGLTEMEEEIDRTIFDRKKYFFKEGEIKTVCIFSTYWNAHNLPSNYIKNRCAQLSDNEIAKFIYGYPFAKTGGEYYPAFDRRTHVATYSIKRDNSLPDHLTLDFNLIPYMTGIHVQIENVVLDNGDGQLLIKVLKEYPMREPHNTTEAVARAYLDDNEGKGIRGIFYYGDAMGNRGVEGFGDTVTRFEPLRTVLRRYLDYGSNRTTKVNVGVNKRRDLMNRLFEGKLQAGKRKVNIIIDPSCVELIKDLQYLKLDVNGKLKEKVKDPATGRVYEKYGHMSDALEYLVAEILRQFI